ncbi:MAG: hypothetical protein IT379_42240 [Deltaproteobacteria bacterium]|nr:hypothetical protein [Deltaproteobacteria bacterium]
MDVDWSADAASHRGEIGRRFQYECGASGVDGVVYGTDLYSDDSSVCTAAVHAGVITLDGGGAVTIEVAPGQSSYRASLRHGIQSTDYGEWPGSFRVLPVGASRRRGR